MFVVIRAEAVPDHLRGFFGRFLIEPTPGLYVGTVSRKVCDALWVRCYEAIGDGELLFVESDSSCEAGYRIRREGETTRRLIDFDGLTLIGFSGGRANQTPQFDEDLLH